MLGSIWPLQLEGELLIVFAVVGLPPLISNRGGWDGKITESFAQSAK